MSDIVEITITDQTPISLNVSVQGTQGPAGTSNITTSTPTNITGLLYGNGTAVSQATTEQVRTAADLPSALASYATTAFVVAGFAPLAHTHAIADVSGLQTALDARQPLDSDLTAIAALTTTSFGRSLLTQADAAATRTTIGAGTGTIGGSLGSTANRVLRTLSTGGSTAQGSAVTIDDAGNVTGVAGLTSTATTNNGSQVMRVQGSGGGFTRINDNGTMVVDGDIGTGTTPLSVRYNGTEQWGFGFNGILNGRSGCVLNIGAGQMHLTHSGSTSQINTFGNLALRPGNLGGGGTSVDVAGNLTASGLIGLGLYTVGTLPVASANAGRIAQVTDSSVTANGSAVAGGGSNRVMVFSNGTTWDVVVA
jgi:hypothetical protein